MASNARSIKIGFERVLGVSRHVVISVKNSAEYDPGQELSDAEVGTLCRDHHWEVVRVPIMKKEKCDD